MKTLITIVSTAIVVVAGFIAWNAFIATPPAPVAGAAGTEFSFHPNFYDNLTVGGYDFATSSQGSVTYTAASIVGSRVIEHNAVAATTATLPTNAQLSALGFLPRVGDTQTLLIHASTTKITLAGATGVTLVSASSTKDISPNSFGRLECVRLGATEARGIWCLLAPF